MSSYIINNNGQLTGNSLCGQQNMRCAGAWVNSDSSGKYSSGQQFSCNDIPSVPQGTNISISNYCLAKTDLYTRDTTVASGNLPVGVSPDIVNIDSVRYQSYINSGNQPGQQGIINVDTDLKAQNAQYVQQITPIIQQILNLYNSLFNANMSVNNLMSQYKENFTGNMKGVNVISPSVFSSSIKESFSNNSMPVANNRESIVNQFRELQAKIKILSENHNMDNIIEERGLVATQQNYIYIIVLLITLGTIGFFYKYTKR